MSWSSKLIEEYQTSLQLPRGHTATKKAELALRAEYAACFEVEKKWKKRFGQKNYNHNMSHDEMRVFCNSICSEIGEELVRLVFDSKEVMAGAAAHYTRGQIHFKYRPAITTVIHELTHHTGQYGHGQKFCEIEEMLFRIAYEKLTGKKPKSDW